jgi:choline kinase
LIDREAELRILRRLARKRIGPRVLGTFANGRFEEYFYARTLLPSDIRQPDVSVQIAKRMRELHDGIELLHDERDGGPGVWRNWDRWVERTEEIVLWTDKEILSSSSSSSSSSTSSSSAPCSRQSTTARRSRFVEAWKDRGLICGVEWPVFRRTVDAYRRWLVEQYDDGMEAIKKQLVFAHNDVREFLSFSFFFSLVLLSPTIFSPFHSTPGTQNWGL